MTYFNPIFRIGLPKFLRQAKASGISGIIVPDLPVEESGDYKKECEMAGVDTIFLASPSTNSDRLKRIVNQSSGYLYLVSLYGVTGARLTIAAPALALIKKYSEALAGFHSPSCRVWNLKTGSCKTGHRRRRGCRNSWKLLRQNNRAEFSEHFSCSREAEEAGQSFEESNLTR